MVNTTSVSKISSVRERGRRKNRYSSTKAEILDQLNKGGKNSFSTMVLSKTRSTKREKSELDVDTVHTIGSSKVLKNSIVTKILNGQFENLNSHLDGESECCEKEEITCNHSFHRLQQNCDQEKKPRNTSRSEKLLSGAAVENQLSSQEMYLSSPTHQKNSTKKIVETGKIENTVPLVIEKDNEPKVRKSIRLSEANHKIKISQNKNRGKLSVVSSRLKRLRFFFRFCKGRVDLSHQNFHPIGRKRGRKKKPQSSTNKKIRDEENIGFKIRKSIPNKNSVSKSRRTTRRHSIKIGEKDDQPTSSRSIKRRKIESKKVSSLKLEANKNTKIGKSTCSDSYRGVMKELRIQLRKTEKEEKLMANKGPGIKENKLCSTFKECKKNFSTQEKLSKSATKVRSSPAQTFSKQGRKDEGKNQVKTIKTQIEKKTSQRKKRRSSIFVAYRTGVGLTKLDLLNKRIKRNHNTVKKHCPSCE